MKLSKGCKVIPGYAFKSSDFSENGFSVIKIANIKPLAIDTNNCQKIENILDDFKMQKYIVEENDILIAMTGQGSVGNVGIVRSITSKPIYINQRVGKIICDEININNLFLYYVLSSDTYRQYLFELGSGTGQPNLSPSQILSVDIPEISYEKQKKIGLELNNLELKIIQNQSYVELLNQCIYNLYQNWFNDFNYPNATGELENDIPEGWEYAPFSMVADRITKKNNPLQTEITITVSAKDGITSDYYKKRVASKDLSKYTVVEKGDFIYNRSSSTGYPVGVIRRLEEFEKVALSPIYFCFRAKKNVSEIYLKYYFNSKNFEDELSQIVGIGSRGHGMLNFNLKDLMNTQILLPPTELQLQFEEIEKPIEQKIALLKQENEVLAEIRDTLLPKLMSGELPVEVGEKNE